MDIWVGFRYQTRDWSSDFGIDRAEDASRRTLWPLWINSMSSGNNCLPNRARSPHGGLQPRQRQGLGGYSQTPGQ